MAKSKRRDPDAPDGYQQMKNDLKTGNFSRLYCFYGEESFLIYSCRNALKKKLISDLTEDFNYHRFTSENFSVENLQDAVEALPMMSETTMVEVQDVDPFSFPESDRNALTAIFSDIPDYCTVLFLFDALPFRPDKRQKKLYSAMTSAGKLLEMEKQSERILTPWIKKQLSGAGKAISDDLCAYLILQTGGSMTTLSAELQKLMCCTDQPQINRYDIDSVVIPVLEAAIFDITRDIGNKDFDSALIRLENLLLQGEEPIPITAVIGKQLREMYAAKILSERGKGAYELAQLYGLWDSAAREVYQQARGFRRQQLKTAIRLCAEADNQMKSSVTDAQTILRDLILHLAQLSSEAAV